MFSRVFSEVLEHSECDCCLQCRWQRITLMRATRNWWRCDSCGLMSRSTCFVVSLVLQAQDYQKSRFRSIHPRPAPIESELCLTPSPLPLPSQSQENLHHRVCDCCHHRAVCRHLLHNQIMNNLSTRQARSLRFLHSSRRRRYAPSGEHE